MSSIARLYNTATAKITEWNGVYHIPCSDRCGSEATVCFSILREHKGIYSREENHSYYCAKGAARIRRTLPK